MATSCALLLLPPPPPGLRDRRIKQRSAQIHIYIFLSLNFTASLCFIMLLAVCVHMYMLGRVAARVVRKLSRSFSETSSSGSALVNWTQLWASQLDINRGFKATDADEYSNERATMLRMLTNMYFANTRGCRENVTELSVEREREREREKSTEYKWNVSDAEKINTN